MNSLQISMLENTLNTAVGQNITKTLPHSQEVTSQHRLMMLPFLQVTTLLLIIFCKDGLEVLGTVLN